MAHLSSILVELNSLSFEYELDKIIRRTMQNCRLTPESTLKPGSHIVEIFVTIGSHKQVYR